MIKIFAKHGTSEKVLIVCEREQAHNVQLMLCEKHGGNWLYVDKLQSKIEYLKFDDGVTYLGFNPKQKRYFSEIKTLT